MSTMNESSGNMTFGNYSDSPQAAEIDCDGWSAVNLWYYLGPMIFLSVALGFFKQRKRLLLDILWGRPGVVYPVNFIDEYNRRWAYAAVFGLLSYETMDLFFDDMMWGPNIPAKYNFIKVFVIAVNVLILCAIFYPLLVCITLRRYLAINILGLIITFCYWGISLSSNRLCDPRLQMPEGEGMLQQVTLAPVYLCYLMLVLAFIYDAVRNIWKMCRKLTDTGKPKVKKSRNIKYMEALMKRTVPTENTTLKTKLVHSVKYTKIAGLKYPTRVICTMVVSAFIIYRVSLQVGYYLDFFAKLIIVEAEASGVDMTVDYLNEAVGLAFPGLASFLSFPFLDLLYSIRYSLILANVLTVLTQAGFMIHIIVTYRRNVRKLIRGSHDWHAPFKKSPTAQLLGGIRYSGYQIAYTIYGFLICYALVTLILFFFSILIVVPIVRRNMTALLAKLISLWPTVLISVGIYLLQYLLVRFAFLQERGAYLALNNRRLYHATCFILFFFNIMLGLFSCLKRVIVSLIFGIIFIPRLDYCILMRGLERFDSGHLAYLGMLMVDEYHNHPVLKAAIEILQERVQKTSYRASDHQLNGDVFTVESGRLGDPLRKKYVRNRWWKLVTLINNPAVTLEIAQEEVRKQMRKGEKVYDTIFPKPLPMLGLSNDVGIETRDSTFL